MSTIRCTGFGLGFFIAPGSDSKINLTGISWLFIAGVTNLQMFFDFITTPSFLSGISSVLYHIKSGKIKLFSMIIWKYSIESDEKR
jgi:hypothetical protein